MPVGAMLGFTLGEETWDRAFAEGLRTALTAFGLPLLGGDTVALPQGAPRMLGLTAIGRAGPAVPSRSGAAPGDRLWVSGSIGDAGAGLTLLRGGKAEPAVLIERYRNPRPRLEAGQRLAGHVSAMMDISDGLLIDATRLGHASGCGVTLRLDWLPLSPGLLDLAGGDRAARLAAAGAGDDYELLFAAPSERTHEVEELSDGLGIPLSLIGQCEPGAGLRLLDGDTPVPLPERLGFEHG
jgi:thiamine-monophosphate kinase